MKNKSILYRFGLVVLVVLLLVLILPSSKIDLSSSLSACSQMTVRTEKITSFASGDELQYHLLSMDDAEYGQLRELLSSVTLSSWFNQTYSSYSRNTPCVPSLKHDDLKPSAAAYRLFRRGVHPEQCLCLGQIPRRRGRRAVSGACGDRGINRSFSIENKNPGRAGGQAASRSPFSFTPDAVPITPNAAPELGQTMLQLPFEKKRMEWRNWRLRTAIRKPQ